MARGARSAFVLGLGGCALGAQAPPVVLTTASDAWPEASCQNPTFSPDGRWLLFTRFTQGYNEGPSQIVKLELATGREQVLLDGAELDADFVNLPGPSWVGDRICFASDANLDAREAGVWVEELYVSTDEGDAITRLTYHGADDGSCIEPLFNPENPDRILFTWEPPGEDAPSRIAVLERDRDNRITLLGDHARVTTRIPSWSHDGRRIAYHRWDLDDPAALAQVWVAEVVFPDDGGRPRLVDERRLEQRRADNTDVSWYVNDRYVLTASQDAGSVDVWAIPVDGGQAVQLTRYAQPDVKVAAPCCSPDGRWLVHELGEPARLVRVELPWREMGLR